MVKLCEVTAGNARLLLAPALGGAIASLDVGGGPVLRPWSGDADDPFTLACNVLAPFSNRISGGGFEWNGTHYPLAANVTGDPFPMHGDAFQRVWDASCDGTIVSLTLAEGGIGPWRYAARQVFDLSESELGVTLCMTNTGKATLPFGGGFHPWFPRSMKTKLAFKAQGLWLEDALHLPTRHLTLSDHPERRFVQLHELPEDFVNLAYTGWRGAARIEQGPDAISCSVMASDLLDTAIVYSPGASAPFFCFEPVSHPVDAVHLPGHPGVEELHPGKSMKVSMRIAWSLH